jgi:hypothetical protein
MSEQTHIDLCERFLAMEKEHSLHEIEVDGVRIWELIRFRIQMRMMAGIGSFGESRRKPKLTIKLLVLRFVDMILSTTFKNPFLAGKAQYLVLGHARRKKIGNSWLDPYIDPILEHLPGEWVYLEGRYEGRHFRPTATSRTRYLDLVDTLAMLARPLSNGKAKILSRDPGLSLIANAVEKTFGNSFGVTAFAVERLRDRLSRLRLYRFLLQRIRPRLVLLCPGYGNEIFIEACRLENVTTAEVQHGVLSRYHFGYSCPLGKVLFADYLLLFGEYWKDRAPFPIPRSRLLTVGYPHLALETNQMVDVSRESMILFISQGVIGKALSQFAVDLANQLGADDEYKVVFKCHPGEAARWHMEYPWLATGAVQVIAGNESDLYTLLAKAEICVGVFSTALYEALAFGCRLLLINLPGVGYMSDLVEDGTAQLANSVQQALSLIKKRSVQVDKQRFFREDWERGFQDALASIDKDMVYKA